MLPVLESLQQILLGLVQDVLSVYQKMYEAQVVSYPRTEDKAITQEQFNEGLAVFPKPVVLSFGSPSPLSSSWNTAFQPGFAGILRTEDKAITQEQFNELLPLAPKIAAVVGVDPSLQPCAGARRAQERPRNHGISPGPAGTYPARRALRGQRTYCRSILQDINDVFEDCDEICIATDNDPSGEGTLLAGEIIPSCFDPESVHSALSRSTPVRSAKYARSACSTIKPLTVPVRAECASSSSRTSGGSRNVAAR